MLKIEWGERDPEDYRRVRGETVAVIYQRWQILDQNINAYNRNTHSPTVFKHFTQ